MSHPARNPGAAGGGDGDDFDSLLWSQLTRTDASRDADEVVASLQPASSQTEDPTEDILHIADRFLDDQEGSKSARIIIARLTKELRCLREAAARPRDDTLRDIYQNTKQINECTQRIESKLAAPSTTKTSWAQIAATAMNTPQHNDPQAPSYHLTIRTRKTGPRDDARRDNRNVVQQVQKYIQPEIRNEVIAAWQLTSGDWKIVFKTEEARNIAAGNTAWATAVFGEGAEITKRTVIMVARGISGKRVLENEASFLEAIKKENPGARIDHIAIPGRKKAADRDRIAVFIHCLDLDSASLLRARNLIWERTPYPVTPYAPDAKVTRCFNCHNFGHTASQCRRTQVCGFCSEPGHHDGHCEVKAREHNQLRSDAAYCVNCKARGHPSYSPQCPERKKRVTQARETIQNRPALLSEYLSTRRAQHRERHRRNQESGDDSPLSTPPSEETSQENQGPPRLGRPTAAASLQASGKAAGQTTLDNMVRRNLRSLPPTEDDPVAARTRRSQRSFTGASPQ